MAASTRRSRWEGIGHATTLGLALAPFAFLFAIWIPPFSLLFGTIAIAARSVDLRSASGAEQDSDSSRSGSGSLRSSSR